MFRKLKMGTRIGAGFGIVILIAAVLGFIGWYGVTRINSYFAEYASWGNIDMVMNEDVNQNILRLANAIAIYRFDPSENNLKALEDSFDKSEKGISEWHEIVKGNPLLEKVAANSKRRLLEIHNIMDKYINYREEMAEIRDKWDDLVKLCLAHLEKTMEDIIDPAKEDAEQSQDIAEMVKWGNIDMVMNEEVIANALKLQTFAHDYAARGNEENWSKLVRAEEGVRTGLTEWQNVISGEPKMVSAAKQIEDHLNTYSSLKNRYHEKVSSANKLQQSITSHIETLCGTLEDAMEKVINPAKEERENAVHSVQQISAFLSMLFSISGVLLGIILAVLITRGISRLIKRAIYGLSEGSEQVASAAAQVSSSSQSLAEGTSEQAASIEETSSAMEEMSSMTKSNAENAGQVNTLMREANEVMVTANESIVELTTSMHDISKASEETQKIIRTIDEIAFQTNLLALNAAVEAARAGEAGAGFAVVADEVRNLAMRAADAARDTSQLIEGTIRRVSDGSSVVTRTNEAFTHVADSFSKIKTLIEEIATASEEQALGIGQVNKAINEIDNVIQQAAASAEESASAAEEMNAQVKEMKNSINHLVTLVGSNYIKE